MSKARSHKAAGIDKRISEPVYPADILSDTKLQMAPPEVKGGWLWTLLHLWRDKVPSMTGTYDDWGRTWGCSKQRAKTIIATAKRLNICDVTESHNDVTLMSRRLERREVESRNTRECSRVRKQKQRDKESGIDPCHTHVTPGKVPPSSSVSISSSPSVLKNNTGGVSVSPELSQLANELYDRPHMGSLLFWATKYPEAWLFEAMKITEAAKARNKGNRLPPAYTEAIFKRWEKEGFPEPKYKPKAAKAEATRRQTAHTKRVHEQYAIGAAYVEDEHGTFEQWVAIQEFKPYQVVVDLNSLWRNRKKE